MARLPTTGADGDAWGPILNDYLSVEHNSDGTHNVDLNAVTSIALGIDLGASPYNMHFDGTNATANTAALQTAIDDAQALLSGNTGIPLLLARPGTMALNGQITLKSASLSGAGTWVGTRIRWDGAAGATVFVKDATVEGGLSYFGLRNLSFFPNVNEPATWLDFTTSSYVVDRDFRLEHLTFEGCSGDAIKLSQWVQCDMRRIYWDSVGGYAIRMSSTGLYTPQYQCTFELTDFYYDHQRSSSPGSGFIYVDNTANAANQGPIAIRNGTIEVNQPWATGNRACITHTHPGSANAQTALFTIEDVAYKDIVSGGMANDRLFYVSATSGTTYPTLILKNFTQSGLAALVAGNLPTEFPSLPLQEKYPLLILNDNNNPILLGDTHFRPFPWSSGTNAFLDLRKTGESYDRWQMTPNGVQKFGDGTAAPNANLYNRYGGGSIGELTTDGHFSIGGYSGGAWNSGHAIMGNYHLWVDASGRLRIKSGAPTGDLDGVIVGSQS